MTLDLVDLLARARDPSTPGPELERIARALALHAAPGAAADPRGRAVLEALAGNPNAPPALLFWLAEDAPDAVAANPALPLLALENPALVVAAPGKGLCNLLERAETPLDWLELAARHPAFYVRSTVASSRRAPPAVLAALAADAQREVRRAVAGNRAAPLSVLARLAGDADWDARIAVARNGSAPPTLLARLARTSFEAERTYQSEACLVAVAKNPATPLATFESFAETRFLYLVVSNPALPESFVELLAGHERDGIRAEVAARPGLPPWLERRLAADESPVVRAAVARATHDPALLARLSLDSEPRVRVAVLDNPRAPDAVLERLANSRRARHRALARQRLAARAKA